MIFLALGLGFSVVNDNVVVVYISLDALKNSRNGFHNWSMIF